MDAMKALITKFTKQLTADKPAPAKEDDSAWMCKDDKTKFCRKLTDDEAKCYWINQPKVAGNFFQNKLKLTTENASFSWNYEANLKPSVKGKTECDQFPSTKAKKQDEAMSAAQAAKKAQDAGAKKDPAADA